MTTVTDAAIQTCLLTLVRDRGPNKTIAPLKWLEPWGEMTGGL